MDNVKDLLRALKASGVGTWGWEIASNRITWSSITAEIFGIDHAEAPGTLEEFQSFIYADDRQKLQEAIQHSFDSNEPYTIEHRIIKPGGDIRWVRGYGEVQRDAQGTPLSMSGTVSDITEKKLAEEETKQSIARYRQLVESSYAIPWELDLSTWLFTYVGPQAEEVLGFPVDMWYQKDFWVNHMHPDDVSWAPSFCVESTKQQKDHEFEYRMFAADGRVVWIRDDVTVISDEHGPIKLQGFMFDITERKLADETLHRTNQKLALHIEQTPLAVIEWNTEFKAVEWNKAAEDIFGYSHDEAMGRHAIGLIVPEDVRSQVDNVWQSLINSTDGRRSTNENITKDGRRIICEWYNTTLVDDKGDVIGVASLAQDITERVQAEQQLQQSNDLLKAIYDASPDMFFIHGSDGRIIDVNDNACSVFGYSREEMISSIADDLSGPDFDNGQAEQLIKRAQQGEKPDFEWVGKKKSGKLMDLEVRLRRLEDAQHKEDIKVLAVIRDITARKKAEKVIRALAQGVSTLELDEFLKDCVRNLAYVYDAKFAFVGRLLESGQEVQTLAVWAGDHFADNFQYSLDGTPCKDILDLKKELIPRDASKLYADDQMLVDMGVESYFGSPLMMSENKIIGLVSVMDVNPMDLESWVEPVLGVYSTRIAIELERNQIEADRVNLINDLEAKNAELERFTYTVSHDLKSPIVTIKGFSGMLLEDVKQNNFQRVNEDINRIDAAADKMKLMLDDLLELSRIGRVINDPEHINMSALFNEAVSMNEGVIKANNIKVHMPNGIPPSFGDKERILEVLINLVENASKYMGDQPQPLITFDARQHDDEITYCVSDNGIGHDSRYSEKIFGLFERLDHDSEGTGIGLAIVRRIIEFHNGRVWAESQGKGQGSVFCFTLNMYSGK